MQSLRKNGKKNGLIALLAWLKFSAMFIYAYESGEILGIKLGCDHKPNKKIIINNKQFASQSTSLTILNNLLRYCIKYYQSINLDVELKSILW